jgi:hypothetical protein
VIYSNKEASEREIGTGQIKMGLNKRMWVVCNEVRGDGCQLLLKGFTNFDVTIAATTLFLDG